MLIFMCFPHDFYPRLIIVLACFSVLSCPCPLLLSPAGRDLEHPGGVQMSCKTRRLLFPLSEHTGTFPWDVWEIRLRNQGVDVWKRVILAQIITLIPAGMGKGLGKGMSVDAI